MRAIDADALIKDRIENGVNWYLGESEGFRQLIERQPTITERTAEIRMRHKYVGESLPECTACDTVMMHKSNYCPNCGAKFQEAANG